MSFKLSLWTRISYLVVFLAGVSVTAMWLWPFQIMRLGRDAFEIFPIVFWGSLSLILFPDVLVWTYCICRAKSRPDFG